MGAETMAENVKVVTDSDFDAEVLQSDVPVVVDFWAPWCGPCRMLSPTIEELATEHEGKVKVCKANADECREKAMNYTITAIPTIMFFKDGKEVKRLVGVRRKDEYEAVLTSLME